MTMPYPDDPKESNSRYAEAKRAARRARENKRVFVEQRILRITSLRLAGATWYQVAKELGIRDGSHASEWYRKHRPDRVKQGLDEGRAIMEDRLNRLLMAVWPKALEGHEGAMDKALRLIDRMCKLHGLDAPMKTEISGPDGKPIQYEMTREELLAKGQEVANRLRGIVIDN